MRVFRNLQELPPFINSVITIGTFDGVHVGHQKVINRISRLAKELKGESVLITFHPHPRMVINPEDDSLRLLNTLEEKLDLIKSMRIDNVVVVPFSRDFSEQSADDYIRKFLVGSFQPKKIVIGYDHKFGKNRTGDFHLLEEMKVELGYELEEISKETLDDIGISSTKIRTALLEGNVHLANELLDYPYQLTGTVVKGFQRGRELGFPTANIQINDAQKLIPKLGIYAVKVFLNRKIFDGLLSIGYNPTFEGINRTLEVYILNFDEDIYGETIKVALHKYLRGELKFESEEALVSAMKKDEENARQFFASPEMDLWRVT